MRRIASALVIGLLATIAVVAPASAITKNYVKDFDHPFVGLIAFYRRRWRSRTIAAAARC